MYIQQLGTSFYLRNEENLYVALTYPQYLTLMDYVAGRITTEEIEDRLKHYEFLEEKVQCPMCNEGTVPRKVIPLLTEELHSHLVHGR